MEGPKARAAPLRKGR